MVSKNTDIYTILAKKHNLHKAVVSMICNHPFIFASRRMADPDDEKGLMFSYLFKIKLKNRILTHKKELYDAKKIRLSLKEQGN